MISGKIELLGNKKKLCCAGKGKGRLDEVNDDRAFAPIYVMVRGPASCILYAPVVCRCRRSSASLKMTLTFIFKRNEIEIVRACLARSLVSYLSRKFALPSYSL
jgi:hypothetical protein